MCLMVFLRAAKSQVASPALLCLPDTQNTVSHIHEYDFSFLAKRNLASRDHMSSRLLGDPHMGYHGTPANNPLSEVILIRYNYLAIPL